MGSPLHRVWRLHARLSRQERVTAEALAEEFEVSRTTIKRDLTVMRVRLGMPIAWDAVACTYYYTRECTALPAVRMDAREALALALAGRILDRSHGSAFGRVLGDMLQKIAPVFGGAVSFAVESVEHVLSRAGQADDHELEHLFPILEAILGRQELRLEYAKPTSETAERRTVHPLHLAEFDQRFVLIAYDCSRRALRNFVLARIHDVGTTGRTFEPPKDFDARAHLRGSLGPFTGTGDYEVRIALDAHAAFYAREKPWHPSQRLSDRGDGRVELTLRLNHLADARHAILRWGPHAEVMAPPDLRTEVREAHRTALARYDV